ncbi:MED6-domain-containing protein [Lentinula aciculospora]|uniref:Mediator of RNA polymerase II transcription subunit 6 n=1 Tax=Lentinula aciculospora TaxID=153920 RepID=A0A9W9DLY3_9AGAR|nr:MED6-domain-containing protein [Lentinula aciculospora]
MMNVSREPEEWKETVIWYTNILSNQEFGYRGWMADRGEKANTNCSHVGRYRLPFQDDVFSRKTTMDISDLHPPDDYSHRFFIWHEWIQANGPLTDENVFEYFTTSMFYDKQSNNQVLRMQTMHTGTSVTNEAEELKRFTGVEFAVVHAQPPSFFVIHKRERLSPEEVKPLAAFFIVNNRIYQSPDLYTVLSNRLLTSLYSIQSTLDSLRAHRPDYTPRTGFIWPIVDPSLAEDAGKKQEDTVANEVGGMSEAPTKRNATAFSGVPKRQQNNTLLMNAMHATAAHSSASLASRTLAPVAESIPTDPAVAASSANRMSATPAPVTPRVPTPKIKPINQEPPPKAAPGGGKKKRKRTMAIENT